METKDIIAARIKEAKSVPGKNSMGTSESLYDPYYLLKQCFSKEEIDTMTQRELYIALTVADYATDVFY